MIGTAILVTLLVAIVAAFLFAEKIPFRRRPPVPQAFHRQEVEYRAAKSSQKGGGSDGDLTTPDAPSGTRPRDVVALVLSLVSVIVVWDAMTWRSPLAEELLGGGVIGLAPGVTAVILAGKKGRSSVGVAALTIGWIGVGIAVLLVVSAVRDLWPLNAQSASLPPATQITTTTTEPLSGDEMFLDSTLYLREALLLPEDDAIRIAGLVCADLNEGFPVDTVYQWAVDTAREIGERIALNALLTNEYQWAVDTAREIGLVVTELDEINWASVLTAGVLAYCPQHEPLLGLDMDY